MSLICSVFPVMYLTYSVHIVLYGNVFCADKLQVELREMGGIKALLSMTQSTHRDILAQIARGIANFAKCESRAIAQGQFTIHTV